jgi:hypothetical protein
VSGTRTDEQLRRLRYLCYLEAYASARTGAVVRVGDTIARVTLLTQQLRTDYEDVSLARAVAFGASDGVYGRPRPHAQWSFERFMRETNIERIEEKEHDDNR